MQAWASQPIATIGAMIPHAPLNWGETPTKGGKSMRRLISVATAVGVLVMLGGTALAQMAPGGPMGMGPGMMGPGMICRMP
jgi:hypothetical protein